MNYFAQIDSNGIVQRVIVADQEFIDTGKVGPATSWAQTWIAAEQRKNYAGIGYKLDLGRDAFIPPKPQCPSWVLDEPTAKWQAPVPMPKDGKVYSWDEPSVSWKEIPAK